MNRFFFLSLLLLASISCFAGKNIIIHTSDDQQIKYGSQEEQNLLMQSQTIKTILSDIKNDKEKETELIVPLPEISKKIFKQIITRLQFLAKSKNSEEHNEKLENIEQLKSYDFNNLFHFIQAVNYLNITHLNEHLNTLYPQLIIKTNDNQEIVCTLEQKHILMQSQIIKNILEACDSENVFSNDDEDNIIILDFLSKQTFDQIIETFLIITDNKKQKNIKLNIIQKLQFYETIDLINFIQAINFLDINQNINKSKQTTLLELGLKELAQRILSHNEWSKLENLGLLLNNLWQIHPAKKLIQQGLILNHSGCNNVIQSTDGQKLISNSREKGTIKIWDLNNLDQEPITLNHPNCENVIQSANGQNIISWSPDEHTIKIWNLNNPSKHSITLNHTDCFKVTQSADGQKIVSLSPKENTIKIWEQNNLNKGPITLNYATFNDAILSTNDQKLIAWSCPEGTIRIWNLNHLDKDPITLNHYRCENVIQNTNSPKFVSWSRQENTIKIWNLSDPYKDPITLNHPNCFKVIQSTDNQKLISLSGQESTIKIWNMNDPYKDSITFNHPKCFKVIQSTDNQKLISLSWQKSTIKIWDLNDPYKNPITLNHSNCDRVIESINGQKLISQSFIEGTIKIWDLDDLYKPPVTLDYPGCKNIIQSSNGQKLISWSEDGTIKILWDMKFLELNLKEIYLLLGIYYANKNNQKIDFSKNTDLLTFQNNYPNSLSYFKTLIESATVQNL